MTLLCGGCNHKLAAILSPLAAYAEKANVFFIHGANMSEQGSRAWAAEVFKLN